MDYKNKVCIVTGTSGFLGSKLVDELRSQGATVLTPEKNRQDDYYWVRAYCIDHSPDYVFHFGSPSSQMLFKKNPAYCIEQTLKTWISWARCAKEFNFRLVYPSTGVLSRSYLGMNMYAQTKHLIEQMHESMGINAIGLRIFATYGAGEAHKGFYASVPHIFARAALDGNPLVVYGDGTQTRDFIYIDDVINAIMILGKHASEDLIDVGSGLATPFTKVIECVKENIKDEIEVENISTPLEYVRETQADTKELNRYYKLEHSISSGIQDMIERMKHA